MSSLPQHAPAAVILRGEATTEVAVGLQSCDRTAARDARCSPTMGNSPYALNSPDAHLTGRTEREGYMASTTTPSSREPHKKLKPKPKTESKSWQTRNLARKDKQTEHAAKLAAKTQA